MSWERLDNMGSRELMTTLGLYCTWTTEDQILRDAYGNDAMECDGYREEKSAVLKRRGLLGLWQELDNFNRARLLKSVERYTWPNGVRYSHRPWNINIECEFNSSYKEYDIWINRTVAGTLECFTLRFGNADENFHVFPRGVVTQWRELGLSCNAKYAHYDGITSTLLSILNEEEKKEQEEAKEEGKFWADNVNEKPLLGGA